MTVKSGNILYGIIFGYIADKNVYETVIRKNRLIVWEGDFYERKK